MNHISTDDISTSNSTNGSQPQPHWLPPTSSPQTIQPDAQNAVEIYQQDFFTKTPVPSRSANDRDSPQIATPMSEATQSPDRQRGWWTSLSLRNKATLIALVLGLMPVLVTGTTIAQLGKRARLTLPQLAILGIGTGTTAILEGAIALAFANRVIRPVLLATDVTKKLGKGELDTRIPLEGEDELAVLGSNINLVADQIQALISEKKAAAKCERLLTDIAWKARQATSAADLISTTLANVRRVLGVERVIIYRFNPDWSGTVVAESVAAGWTKALDEKIDDPCFRTRYIPQYQNGRVRAIDDIYNEPGLNDCHVRTLEQFEVKANIVAPIRKDEKLVGLLIAHQCAAPRQWQQAEVDFFLQLASQFEYALDHVSFIEQLQAAAKRERLLTDIAWKARQASNPTDLIATTLASVRRVLGVERVIIYRFNPDWSGTVVAESVAAGWTKALDEKIDDPCFRARYIPQYQNGRVRAINDIYSEPGLNECHIRTLEQFEVKANLVAPMRKDEKLVGLLIAHQCAAPRQWQQAEVDFFLQLASQIDYALDHVGFIEQLQAAAKRERLLTDIAWKARQASNPADLIATTLANVRRVLGVERVIIYRFNPDWSGTVVAESVAAGWTKALDEKIDDPCFRARYIPQYQNGRVRAIDDIYSEPGLNECHIRTLEQFEVKANLVAPMRKDEKLVGLLIAHQCAAPRQWQQAEVDFFLQLASQIDYALDHVGFIEQLEQARQAAEAVSEEQRQQKEELQGQLEEFLQKIEGAFQGDLTVRAGVTAGEMGIVADFFNALIESLQRIVLQVQAAAGAVTQTVQGSEADVQTLSSEAARQREAIANISSQIQVMATSLQGVATSAQQATLKVAEADQTVQVGDEAMNQTVDGILAIQQTVEETAFKVKRLGEASQKISRVVSLIRDLASQTSILALNASIGATGSQIEGQGFAVVAEEVRAIAEQSAAATKEIEQIVEEIQVETTEVVKAMEAGIEQVSSGTELVKTTRAKLTSISQVSAQIRTLVEEMAQAATSQVQTSASVSQTMQEVYHIANLTSGQSVAVADSFNQLLGVAQELQENVSQFRVN